MLRATTACTFSTSQLPKVVRTWCVLYILTWKCASRHNGVQFFISHLASWLRTRRFSEPTFRPSGATNHWKNTVFRDFPTFSRICIFFLLILSLLTLLTSAFQLSILSEVSLLNFLRSSILKPSFTPIQVANVQKFFSLKIFYDVLLCFTSMSYYRHAENVLSKVDMACGQFVLYYIMLYPCSDGAPQRCQWMPLCSVALSPHVLSLAK